MNLRSCLSRFHIPPHNQRQNVAYSLILTRKGYPCVFWQDYYNLQLAKEDSPNGIASLVKIHEQNAVGTTTSLYVDDNLYSSKETEQPTNQA
jgi:hypothetical protein